MIVFRQADPRYPFLWSGSDQPAARWHAEGSGPAHYFADTPHGAWAELLRHEEISDPEDAATLRRALWAIEIDDAPVRPATLPPSVMTGGADTYPACQEHARQLRGAGATRIVAPSAGLLPDGATGRRLSDGLEVGAAPRDGRVIVLFEAPASLAGWKVVADGSPPAELLPRVRHLRRT